MFLPWMMMFGAIAAAATYECHSEFGERVPLRKIVLQPGRDCQPCEHAGVSPPSEIVDDGLSEEWNAVEEANERMRVKRRAFFVDNRKVFLDTIYRKRGGPSFDLLLECAETQPCTAIFAGKAKNRLVLPASLFDQRIPGNGGRAEISFTSRNPSGLMVRVFKDAIPLRDGSRLAISASGEWKLLREEANFSMDVGVDESLMLLGDQYERLAALELTLRCRRK